MIELAQVTQHSMIYSEAWLYCITLDYDAHKDWRMPSISEYLHIDNPPDHWHHCWFATFLNEQSDVGQLRTLPVRDINVN